MTALLLIGVTATMHADDGDPTNVPTGVAMEADQTEAVKDMRKQLENDPSLQEALVDQIANSKIAGAISTDPDAEKRRGDIRSWVKGDLASAAEIALGLAKDEKDGTHLFENGVVKQLKTSYHRNNTGRGAYGVLKGAAKTSKQTSDPNQAAGEEEKREQLRSLFEGTGSMGGKTITGKAPDGKLASDTQQTPALANSFYDRLSAGNIRGYSPHLMAMQSALNTHRPPGAPKLIETGKLDYATLSYPAYGVKFDLGNLEERLRRARVAELATMAGVRLTERDMQDPGLEARLLAKVPADKLPKRFAARAASIARAKEALAAFEAAAAKSNDPAQITKGLLVELSGRQREAARWLTAASLEEELARIEAEEGFLTPDLLALIDAAPADAPTREAYKRRGEAYKGRLAELKSSCQKSLDALRSDDWLAHIAEIDKMLSESQAPRRTLSRDISDYRLVPYRVSEAVLKQARWREFLENLIVKYAGGTAYGRSIANRRAKLSRFLAIFGKIAAGEADSAHASLADAEGSRR